MNKLIFLDVDGVLNSYTTSVIHGDVGCYGHQMNPVSVLLLLRLHLVSNCDFVLSSSWKLMKDHRRIIETNMHRAGWPDNIPIPFIGITPDLPGWRGNEIDAWLQDNSPALIPWKEYIILDDTKDFSHGQPLVHIDPRHGFAETHFSVIMKHWKIDWTQLYKYTLLTTTKTEIKTNVKPVQ